MVTEVVAIPKYNTKMKSGFVRQNTLLAEVLPFSSATLWRKVKAGTFPQPVKLSAGVTAWRSSRVVC
jgi:prophage regulatory protein